ncbi:hypothetical protein VTK26DRAFT_3556 [Humicola hyalothermophila]
MEACGLPSIRLPADARAQTHSGDGWRNSQFQGGHWPMTNRGSVGGIEKHWPPTPGTWKQAGWSCSHLRTITNLPAPKPSSNYRYPNEPRPHLTFEQAESSQ